MSKEKEQKKRDKKNLSVLILGIIIGAVLGLILSFAIFILIGNSSLEIGEDTGKITFNNEDVHLNIKNDFELSNKIPVYDESYCKKKFYDKYGEEATSCLVNKIKTFSRLNPLVIEVECVCDN